MDQSLQFFVPPTWFQRTLIEAMELGRNKFLKKRRFPDETFVEYDVVDVLTETGPGKYFFIVYVINANRSRQSSSRGG